MELLYPVKLYNYGILKYLRISFSVPMEVVLIKINKCKLLKEKTEKGYFTPLLHYVSYINVRM